MAPPIIRIKDLGKEYRIGHRENKQTTIGDTLNNSIKNAKNFFLRRSIRSHTKQKEDNSFWALKDISFEVYKGERLGIIGRNGAGKSTLLKIISRITEPSVGEVRIKGRVASLLEVGTGFHGELTGRENIFLNGAILGMSKAEIRRKFDEIVAFAEVERFLDTPVKRYSSGMYVRLAFSVAAHLEPEILIVDEVLAVGDMQFQKKCLGKMESVGKDGRTVLFVSHNMATITSLCNKTLLLESGQIKAHGETSDVILRYYSSDNNSSSSFTYDPDSSRVGDDYAQLLGGGIQNESNQVLSEVPIDQQFKVCMVYRIKSNALIRAIPNFHFFTSDGTCAFISSPVQPEILPVGTYTAECYIPARLLNEGTYFVGLALSSFESGVKVHYYEQNCLSFNVRDDIEANLARNGYGGPIPGIVRPVLNWKIREFS